MNHFHGLFSIAMSMLNYQRVIDGITNHGRQIMYGHNLEEILYGYWDGHSIRLCSRDIMGIYSLWV